MDRFEHECDPAFSERDLADRAQPDGKCHPLDFDGLAE
jgi:hypothetical protein